MAKTKEKISEVNVVRAFTWFDKMLSAPRIQWQKALVGAVQGLLSRLDGPLDGYKSIAAAFRVHCVNLDYSRFLRVRRMLARPIVSNAYARGLSQQVCDKILALGLVDVDGKKLSDAKLKTEVARCVAAQTSGGSGQTIVDALDERYTAKVNTDSPDYWAGRLAEAEANRQRHEGMMAEASVQFDLAQSHILRLRIDATLYGRGGMCNAKTRTKAVDALSIEATAIFAELPLKVDSENRNSIAAHLAAIETINNKVVRAANRSKSTGESPR